MLNAVIMWFHILSVLIWIGGMLYTLFVLRPNLDKLGNNRAVFMKGIMDRFFPLVWFAIVTLFITGGINAKYYVHNSFFVTKLLIYAVMVVVFSYIYFGLYKKLPNVENKAQIMQKITLLIKVNFSLGLIVIFLIELAKYL